MLSGAAPDVATALQVEAGTALMRLDRRDLAHCRMFRWNGGWDNA